MRTNITESEEMELQGKWREIIANFPPETERDMWKSVHMYIDACGLPETAEHPELFGEELSEYLESHGLSYEDVRSIIED